MNLLPINNINRKNFAKYGTVFEHARKKNGYEPLVTVKSTGWIWAIFTYKNKTIKEIECHLNTKESFEPVAGATIIVLAEPKRPERLEAFLLDQAVLLDEGVWHNVLALSDTARVKITENSRIITRKYKLSGHISVSALTGQPTSKIIS